MDDSERGRLRISHGPAIVVTPEMSLDMPDSLQKRRLDNAPLQLEDAFVSVAFFGELGCWVGDLTNLMCHRRFARVTVIFVTSEYALHTPVSRQPATWRTQS